jgi:RNA polymerase sigma-70 factor, ECF subfamily
MPSQMRPLLVGVHMTPKEVEEMTVLWTSAQRTVAAFIRTLVIDLHDAEEVLQRVAVTLVRKYAEYDPSRPFVAWALGFAKFESLAYLRKRGSERLVFSNALVEQIAETYEQATQEAWPYPQFVGECVEELDGRSRRAIQLRYGGNLKTAQIARQMELSDGAVRMVLSRARTLMRKCIEARIMRWRDTQ